MGINSLFMFGWEDDDEFKFLSTDWLDRYGLERFFGWTSGASGGCAAYGVQIDINPQTGSFELSAADRQKVQRGHEAFCREFERSPELKFLTAMTGDVDVYPSDEYGMPDEASD